MAAIGAGHSDEEAAALFRSRRSRSAGGAPASTQWRRMPPVGKTRPEERHLPIPDRARGDRDQTDHPVLPPYTPDLGPDKLANADLKRQVADHVITDHAELIAEVRSILRSIQELPARVIGYFQARYTKHASDTI